MNLDLGTFVQLFGNLKALSAVLGIGVFGSVGVIFLLRRAINAWDDLFDFLFQYFIKKYWDKIKVLFTAGEGKSDLDKLVLLFDNALERTADPLEKTRIFKKKAQWFRDLIKTKEGLLRPAVMATKETIRKGREA
jgi:hypothetical protein